MHKILLTLDYLHLGSEQVENLVDMVFKSYGEKMLYQRLINIAEVVIKLKPSGLFKYLWPSSGHQATHG